MSEAFHSNHAESQPAKPRALVTESSRELLQAISNYLLSRPEKISIDVVHHASEVAVQLQVPKDEISKMIGIEGRTAHSLRCLLAALSQKTGTRFTLQIIEQQVELKAIPPLRDRIQL